MGSLLERVDEEVDAKLPGKVSKRKLMLNRTENRHRWASRKY